MMLLARSGFTPKEPHYNVKKDTPLVNKVNRDLATSALVSLDSGADVMGKLLTENIVELDSALTAIESKLGWTVIGKQNFRVKDNFMTTVSMHVGRIPLHELWELEVLWISDPTGTDKIENDLSDYKEKIKILPSGRYEVELPWKYDSMNLHDNMKLTWKRHEKMINKIKCSNYFDDFKKVFTEWEKGA
ncbi:DUF1758 domain-containing protein [Nephila pilipes]|uniref:DUF1758 domain-containing protein n=1 Tax=Nephila pilipes TaxID=299642 RepID=A0A8X6MN46_NEPPI|nr:DUF1758 domain-containing protein [Nephila pilipes]